MVLLPLWRFVRRGLVGWVSLEGRKDGQGYGCDDLRGAAGGECSTGGDHYLEGSGSRNRRF